MTKNNDQLLVYNNSIHFNFKDFIKEYAVQISIDGEIDDDSSNVSYNAKVHYTKEYTKPYFFAEVVISNFLLNEKPPQSTMQNIALECSKTIEKCVFQVNTKNEIISLDNYKEILDKWRKTKNAIIQEYEGEIVDKYLILFEKSLVNETILLDKIKKNVFISQYFFAIFDEPYHGFQKKNVEIFNFFNVDYQEEVIVEIENQGDFDENGKATISKQVIKNQDNTELFPIKSYKTKYILNRDFHIEIIEGQFISQNKKYSYEIGSLNV